MVWITPKGSLPSGLGLVNAGDTEGYQQARGKYDLSVVLYQRSHC